MECVILIGLPASGKSTFFRERFAGTHDHVSKDLLRNNRTRQRRQEQLISESLASGRSVVVDNTNPSVAVRAPIIAAARKHGAEVVGYFFVTDAADALRRNRARDGRDVAFCNTRAAAARAGRRYLHGTETAGAADACGRVRSGVFRQSKRGGTDL